MRWLTALGLSTALLAGCASDDSEPSAAENTEAETIDEAEEQPSDDEVADTDDEQQDAAEDDTTADEAADEGAATGSVDVEIGDFFFDDDQLAIEVGETVTWTHQGDITHNVTSRDESFVSDNLSSGDTFDHTFDTAGSFEYVCTLHGQMMAAVEVT